MSTKTPDPVVQIHDRHPFFQPIRLSSASLIELHRRTNETLEEFVADHREKYPVGPTDWASRRR